MTVPIAEYWSRHGVGSRRTWSRAQAALYLSVVALAVASACLWPSAAPVAGGAVVLGGYALVVLMRSTAVLAGLVLHDVERGADSGEPDEPWPVYTVLLPVYREAAVLPALRQAMEALDYPRDRLDALILVEEDDVETRAAAEAVATEWLRVVVVPPGEPRTKPRACNAGLAEARGEFVVVFDAEDRPEPGQLKQAVRVFRRLPPSVACLQSHLNYYNSRDNLLTRCFTLEYAAWFDLYLPGLHSLRAVIPLGGTSNHFRTETLRALQGWDPWNVTEDCELGVRLAQAGLETRILDSTTWEEAVSRLGPWIRQRSRWVKGYWQTHLLHTRSPAAAVRDLGAWRTLAMLLTVGGQVAVLLANPFCWLVAGLWLWRQWPLHDPRQPFSKVLLVLATGLALCNGLFVVIHAVAALRRRRADLLPVCLAMPFYWLFVSIGAWRGVLQFFTAPFRWEKTPHGLTAAAYAMAPDPPRRTPEDMPAGLSKEPRPPSVAVFFRRRLPRWGSVALLGATVAAIAVVAGPLASRLASAFGDISLDGRSAGDERTVEECWVGRRDASVTLEIDPGPRHAGRPSRWAALAYLKVDDGDWYEAPAVPLQCPAANGPAQVTVSLPFDGIWSGRGHGAVCGAWSVRRVRSLGVRVYGPDGPPQSVRIAGVEPGAPAAGPALAAVVHSAPAAGAVWQRWEARFGLGREYANPFDPAGIDVWGVFTGPTGALVRVPAFYTRDYSRRMEGPVEALDPVGAPYWAVRFLPPSPGAWRWRIEARDGAGGRAETPDRPLDVAAAKSSGPVRVEPGQPWFRRADGSFFYPVGLNIRSPSDSLTDREGSLLYTPGAPDPQGGARAIEGFLDRMGKAGITLGRVWMAPWSGGLEWSKAWPGYHGLGRYNLQNAWRLDRVLDKAEADGCFVELVFQPHGPFAKNYDVQWNDNPYNQALGGPLKFPGDVLTDPAARRWMANRLRYCAARWGASPALFGWTLWVEADQVNRREDALREWHREATELLGALDCGQHPISTEFTSSRISRDIWTLPGLGYVQVPEYDFGPGLIPCLDDAHQVLGHTGKPLFVEEYAGHAYGGDPGWVAQQVHDGLWLGWTRPFAASPMAWWWNFILGRGLERYHARFAGFIRGEDLRGRSWRHLTLRVEGAPTLAAHARASADRADLWICGPASSVPYRGHDLKRAALAWRRVAGEFDPLAADPGRQFDVPAGAVVDLGELGLADGVYRVELWDTWSSAAPTVLDAVVAGGRGRMELPALVRDVAVKVRLPESPAMRGGGL